MHIKKTLTVMIIPGSGTRRPLNFHFTIRSFFVFLSGIFLLLGWSAFVTSQHINYQATLRLNDALRNKMRAFAEEMEKNREELKEVRRVEGDLRSLLGLKTKQAIFEYEGKGGPSGPSPQLLQKILDREVDEIKAEDLRLEVSEFRRDIREEITSYKEVKNHIDLQRKILRATPRQWPCDGRISSRFGYRYHPISRQREFHTGLDIANWRGTPVRATADGWVTFADWQRGYGRLVIINHGYGFNTIYGHNSKLKVKRGQKIKRGQVIALMGSTGTSTGDHVHYEIWVDGKLQNPARYLYSPQY